MGKDPTHSTNTIYNYINYVLTNKLTNNTTSYVLPIYTWGDRVFNENIYIPNNLPLREVTPEKYDLNIGILFHELISELVVADSSNSLIFVLQAMIL